MFIQQLQIGTTAALDEYYKGIEGIIERQEFDVRRRIISADDHKTALDSLLKIASDPTGLGRAAEYLHDIVCGGHVDVYREYAPRLRDVVTVYERGMRAMHEEASR